MVIAETIGIDAEFWLSIAALSSILIATISRWIAMEAKGRLAEKNERRLTEHDSQIGKLESQASEELGARRERERTRGSIPRVRTREPSNEH